MTTTKTIQKTLLLSLMSLALIVGCDKGGDEKKTAAKTDKGDKKGGDDVKAPDAKAPDPAPEPEPPAGPVFTSKNIIGEPVSSPIKPFDLGAMELPGLVIQAPEGTKAEPKSPSGFTLLDTRVNYSITVTEGAFDKAKAIETFGIVDPAGKSPTRATPRLSTSAATTVDSCSKPASRSATSSTTAAASRRGSRSVASRSIRASSAASRSLQRPARHPPHRLATHRPATHQHQLAAHRHPQ